MTRYLPLVAVLLFAGVGAALPRPAAVSRPDVIRFVSSLPRSGSSKGQTDSIVSGIRLALIEVDYRLTVGGREYRLEYTDLDDASAMAGEWTADAEIANANLAVRDPDVMVYIGTYNSAAARISMPILNRAGMLMVSPANTSETLTKPGTGDRSEPLCFRPTGAVNFVRVVPTDDLQGSLGAEWAQDLGARRVYVLDSNDTYGKGIANQFERRAKEIGLAVLGRESIDGKSTDYLPLMTKIRSLAPDLVYFGGTTQNNAGQLVKDMDTVGMAAVKFMAPDGCYEKKMIENAGPKRLAGRFYVTFTGMTPDRLQDGPGKAFYERYERILGEPPREAYAIYGYESARVALEAVRRAGAKDRQKVLAAGRGITDFVGAAGLKWSFDPNGDITLYIMTGSTVAASTAADGSDVGEFKAVKDLVPRTKSAAP